MDIFKLYKKFTQDCRGQICTDTRKVAPGSLFFGWKGESSDGNAFAKQALEKGCRYAVIDNPDYALDERYIIVDSSIEALQMLARYHRQQFHIPVIAIAGSNGKTTTKELMADVLGGQKNVISPIGSLNNHVGVPKTLLRINKETDIAIIEMGANHVGEINELCKIAEPNYGVITNIGRDHIGFFGGEEFILQANLELYDFLKNNDGQIFVDKNEKVLFQETKGMQTICYGNGLTSEFGVSSLETSPYVSLSWKHYVIPTQLTGEYNVQNISCAIAVGVHFEIQDDIIIEALQEYKPVGNRSQIERSSVGDNIIIKDFYNANRTSMELALENLALVAAEFDGREIVAILGDMFELGDFAQREHQAVAAKAQELDIDRIILVGSEFKKISLEGVTQADTTEKALEYVRHINLQNSIILLKASNGMNFQLIYEQLA